MDEFNPYAPPAASAVLEKDASPPGYRVYLGVNVLYAVLIMLFFLILLLGGRIRFAAPDLLVTGIFLAPLVSCWSVVMGYSRVFRFWRFVQALIAGVLLVFCLQDLGRGALAGIGLFMTLANVLSLMTSSRFHLLRQANSRFTGVVQKG